MTRIFCDMCGEEKRSTKRRSISTNYEGNCLKDFDVCEACSKKLNFVKRKAEVDFLKQSAYWKEMEEV